jgi:hypothetical protein
VQVPTVRVNYDILPIVVQAAPAPPPNPNPTPLGTSTSHPLHACFTSSLHTSFLPDSHQLHTLTARTAAKLQAALTLASLGVLLAAAGRIVRGRRAPQPDELPAEGASREAGNVESV